MLEELNRTIKAQLYERASSPLLASFILAWIGWNYRFVLIIFSSMTLPDKFAFIEQTVFPTAQSIWLNGVVCALLAALALIFIYPIPAKYTYEYSRKRQRELKEIQQRVDEETPLTRQEARELRKEALRVPLELENELEQRRGETRGLKELVASLENKLAQAKLPSITQLSSSALSASLNKRNTSVPSALSSTFLTSHNNSRVLVTEDQYMEESLKNIIMTEPFFENTKFMVDVRGGKVTVSQVPANLLTGKVREFIYKFDTGTDGKNISSEIKRIKAEIIHDLKSDTEDDDELDTPERDKLASNAIAPLI